MIRSREELLQAIGERLGDDTSDSALGLIEDVTDTLTDLEKKAGNPADYEKQLADLDKSWRERYKARFFGTGAPDPEGPEEEQGADEREAPQTFEELFS